MGHFTDTYEQFYTHTPDLWIETGTFMGGGVMSAIELGFKEIHTIDVYQRMSRESFPSDKRVVVWEGKSHEILAGLLSHPSSGNRDTVFWLDAHFQGDRQEEMDQSVGECPLLLELDEIIKVKWTASVLVCIDDLSLFLPEYWERHPRRGLYTKKDWPTEEQIKDKLKGWGIYQRRNIAYAIPSKGIPIQPKWVYME